MGNYPPGEERERDREKKCPLTTGLKWHSKEKKKKQERGNEKTNKQTNKQTNRQNR